MRTLFPLGVVLLILISCKEDERVGMIELTSLKIMTERFCLLDHDLESSKETTLIFMKQQAFGGSYLLEFKEKEENRVIGVVHTLDDYAHVDKQKDGRLFSRSAYVEVDLANWEVVKEKVAGLLNASEVDQYNDGMLDGCTFYVSYEGENRMVNEEKYFEAFKEFDKYFFDEILEVSYNELVGVEKGKP